MEVVAAAVIAGVAIVEVVRPVGRHPGHVLGPEVPAQPGEGDRLANEADCLRLLARRAALVAPSVLAMLRAASARRGCRTKLNLCGREPKHVLAELVHNPREILGNRRRIDCDDAPVHVHPLTTSRFLSLATDRLILELLEVPLCQAERGEVGRRREIGGPLEDFREASPISPSSVRTSKSSRPEAVTRSECRTRVGVHLGASWPRRPSHAWRVTTCLARTIRSRAPFASRNSETGARPVVAPRPGAWNVASQRSIRSAMTSSGGSGKSICQSGSQASRSSESWSRMPTQASSRTSTAWR